MTENMLKTFESFSPFSKIKFNVGDKIIYTRSNDTLSGREGEIVRCYSRTWGTNDYDISVKKGGSCFYIYSVNEKDLKVVDNPDQKLIFDTGDLVKYKDKIGKVTYSDKSNLNCSVLFVQENKISIIKNSELKHYDYDFKKGDNFIFVRDGNMYNRCYGEVISKNILVGEFFSKLRHPNGITTWMNTSKINMIPVADTEIDNKRKVTIKEKDILDINGEKLKRLDKVIYRNPESKYYNEIFEFQGDREDGKCEISKNLGGYKRVWVELKYLEKIDFDLNDEVIYNSVSGGTLNGNVYVVKSINDKGEIEVERIEGSFIKKLTTDAKNLKKYNKPVVPYTKPKKKKKKIEKPKPILVHNRRNIAEREGRKRVDSVVTDPVVTDPVVTEPIEDIKIEQAKSNINSDLHVRTFGIELKYMEYLDNALSDKKIGKEEYEEKMKKLQKRIQDKG